MNEPALLETMPFAVQIGVVLDSASPQEVVGRLPWAPERCTAGGLMHGGVVEVSDDEGRLVAQVTQNQAVLTG